MQVMQFSSSYSSLTQHDSSLVVAVAAMMRPWFGQDSRPVAASSKAAPGMAVVADAVQRQPLASVGSRKACRSRVCSLLLAGQDEGVGDGEGCASPRQVR